MVDPATDTHGRAGKSLSVMVVTQRRNLVNKLTSASRALASRGVQLAIFQHLSDALEMPHGGGARTFVFDALTGCDQMSELPRLWPADRENHNLILLTDHRDPMLRRSAMKVGYDDCVCLEEAMRADFLFRLYELSFGSRDMEKKEPDFELMFAGLTSAIVITEMGGRVVYVNAPFFEAAGLLRSNLRGTNLATFFPEISPAMLKNCPIGETRLLEFRRASGNTMTVEAGFLRLPDDLESFVAIRF